MKILYLHSVPLDAEKANVLQVLHMCNTFTRLGHEVILGAPFGGATEGLESLAAKRLGQPSVDFSVFGFRRFRVAGRLNSLGGAIPAVLKVRGAEPDVVFLRNEWMLTLLPTRGRDVIFESHNPFPHATNRWVNGLLIRRIVARARQPNLRLFVAISNKMRELWRGRGVPDHKLVAVHDGFDAAMFENPPTREEARRLRSLPVSQKIVVYTGSLYEDRGISRIVSLAEHFRDVLFLVVGGPEDRAIRFRDQASARGLENFRLTGRVPHTSIPSYLAAADVLLMVWSRKVPTIDYCSPLKLLEYLAAGRIVVGDGFPTIHEVVEDGENTFLVEPENDEALRAALDRALHLERPEQIQSRARELAFSKYTWEHRCRLILSYYEARARS
ncbi:MAG: glycosyltransferase family 4 protein [Acidobacteriota bacterium]